MRQSRAQWKMVGPGSEPFVGLRQAMDQLLAEGVVDSPYQPPWSGAGNGWSGAGNGTTQQAPPLDVYATDEAVVVVAAVPGLHPEDLRITCAQGTLLLSGVVANAAGEEAVGATWFLHELGSGRYRRAVTLPFAVDADRAEARFAHGIVTVVLPKAERARPTAIAVAAGEASPPAGAGPAAPEEAAP